MSHYYDFKEWKYPSVTTIIGDATDKSGALVQWGTNQCVEWIRANRKGIKPFADSKDRYVLYEEDFDPMRFAYKTTSQTALDVGSEVHGWIEKYLGSKDYPNMDYAFYYGQSNQQAHNAVEAFCDWAEEHKIRPIALEQTVFGDCWAGTLDFLGYFNDKLYVIDWKSSKAHYPEMRYQVAAYRNATKPTFLHNEQVQGCGVLRLDKETGLPDWKDTSKTYERDLQIFTAMKQLYFLRHPRIAQKAGWKG